MRRVVQVRPVKNFEVYVYFDDGAIRLFDVKQLIHRGGIFQKIASEDDFFQKCTVMNGTLAWDLSGRFDPSNCIDIDPETIYANGKPTSEQLDTEAAG